MTGIVLVETIFSWGFVVKPPYLALGGQSTPYPPPTTLIGALSYPYSRFVGDYREVILIDKKPHSPAVRLLEMIKYAVMGYRSQHVIQYMDINKYIIYAYLRSEHREDEKMWSGVMGVSKTYSPPRVRSVIAYLVEDKYIDVISKIVHGLVRIGSKEGLVSVVNKLVIEKPNKLDVKRVKTIFPTPVDLVEQPISNCSETFFWKPVVQAYSEPTNIHDLLVKYYVPGVMGKVYGGSMELYVNRDKAVVLETPYSPLVVPKEVVSL